MSKELSIEHHSLGLLWISSLIYFSNVSFLSFSESLWQGKLKVDLGDMF